MGLVVLVGLVLFCLYFFMVVVWLLDPKYRNQGFGAPVTSKTHRAGTPRYTENGHGAGCTTIGNWRTWVRKGGVMGPVIRYLRSAPRSTRFSKWIVNISENPYSKWPKNTVGNWSYKPLYVYELSDRPTFCRNWALKKHTKEIIQDEDETTPKTRASHNPSCSCIFVGHS